MDKRHAVRVKNQMEILGYGDLVLAHMTYAWGATWEVLGTDPKTGKPIKVHNYGQWLAMSMEPNKAQSQQPEVQP